MKPWHKLVLFLLPAVAATLFVFWRFSPGQAVIRRAEVIFTSLEKGTLSAGTPSQKAERFLEVAGTTLEIDAPPPLPSGSLEARVAAAYLEQFQNGVTSCKITREEETVSFPGDGLAVYQARLAVDVAQGPGRKFNLHYDCRLEFEKSGRDWILRAVGLTAL